MPAIARSVVSLAALSLVSTSSAGVPRCVNYPDWLHSAALVETPARALDVAASYDPPVQVVAFIS